MPAGSAGYIMEDSREARRLADKVDPQAWVDAYIAPHLTYPARILDIGCGPGTIAAQVARSIPHVHVTAVDRSPRRARAAQDTLAGLPNACAVQGDANALAFRDGTFDFVYTRFLLEYLPRPERTVAEMARVCRPGGIVMLQDVDGQFLQHYPPEPDLETAIRAALAGLASTGFDPLIGRKLFSLARTTGLAIRDMRIEAYHRIAGRPDASTRRAWELKLDIALPAMARALGSERDAADLKTRLLTYLGRDDTLTWSQLFTVWATVSRPG
jgi:SAM-dependent methyltransferase